MPSALGPIASIASIVGLALTIWVLVVAKGARTAAKRAAASVRSQNLADELDAAREKINQAGSFLEPDGYAVAAYLARESAQIVRRAIERWCSEAAEDLRNEVLLAIEQTKQFALAAAQPEATSAGELRKAQIVTADLLAGLAGRARSVADRRLVE